MITCSVLCVLCYSENNNPLHPVLEGCEGFSCGELAEPIVDHKPEVKPLEASCKLEVSSLKHNLTYISFPNSNPALTVSKVR